MSDSHPGAVSLPDAILRPDHEPGPDCPNVPFTCLICQPKAEAAEVPGGKGSAQ